MVTNATTATPTGAVAGDIVEVANITWSCSLGNKVYPEIKTQTIDLLQTVNQAGKDSASAKFDVITTIIQNFSNILHR